MSTLWHNQLVCNIIKDRNPKFVSATLLLLTCSWHRIFIISDVNNRLVRVS